jgi:hypothetical protein
MRQARFSEEQMVAIVREARKIEKLARVGQITSA